MKVSELQKVGELSGDAESELQDELQHKCLAELKERLREIKAAKLALKKMEDDLETFKEQDVDTAVFD